MTKFEPICFVVVRPTHQLDAERVSAALVRMAEADGTFTWNRDSQTDDFVILGVGELQLEIIIDRMRREFEVQTNVGQPQVVYHQTICRSSEAEGKYIRRGQYGHVKIRIGPNEGRGFEFFSETAGETVPLEHVKAVEQGIREAMESGILGGYELVDVKATLFGGSHHEADSNEMAFRIAASMAFKEAVRKANPVLLEPVMSIEVVVPEEFVGMIIGDLNNRRAHIEGIEHSAGSQVVKVTVPLSETFGYSAHLRSTTQGRATYSMKFSRYEEAPKRTDQGTDSLGFPAKRPQTPRPGSRGAAVEPDKEDERH